MRSNIKNTTTIFTHEGAPARHIDPEAQLRRLSAACLLWEDTFYVDGVTVAEQLVGAVNDVVAKYGRDKGGRIVMDVAIEAREKNHLRHLPLLLMSVYAHNYRGDERTKVTIETIIQRADELAEFLAIYCKVAGMDPKAIKNIPGQVKKGLARAFGKFDDYALGKYDRKNVIRLLDVARLVHPQHTDSIGKLVKGELKSPDTWEVGLSKGDDKGETFTRLLTEGKLGYLALLRNLRNMVESKVEPDLVRGALIEGKGAQRVLPFRYIAAARHAPMYANEIQQALLSRIGLMPHFPGRTLVLVDVSGSMSMVNLSKWSEMKPIDAAAAVASTWAGDRRVFAFANSCTEVQCFPGLPGIESIVNVRGLGGGTALGAAVTQMNGIEADRLVVITDEQSHDPVPDPVHEKAYMINIASNQNGVGYGKWVHIDGWSENVFRFMHAVEA